MEKLLFTELRVLKAESGKTEVISKEGLKLAFLDQENLNALGFQLKEDGLIQLAQNYSANPQLEPLFKRVQKFEPAIEVSPMYPNFPKQVLEMEELEFRTHQFVHYLTTYGMEFLLGEEVKQGWLPKTEDVMERVEDAQLLKLKTLDYLTESQIEDFVVKKVIGKKERLLPGEIEIARSVTLKKDAPVVQDIPFKENIYAIYGDVILESDSDTIKTLFAKIKPVFKHPGDVLELTEYLVVKNKFRHLRTSVKRALVELIESFSDYSIEENLASNRWSKRFLGKGGKRRSLNRNIALIDYLSFSRFSKNPAAMALVNELKDGKLFSWNQKLEAAYAISDLDKARALLLERPGMYFRQINRLYKLGVPEETLSDDVETFAEDLKTQSIVSTLNNYNKDVNVSKVFYEALIHNLMSKTVEQIAGKKIYIDESEFDLDFSKISLLDKSKEGGYIQSGMAIRIPEDVKLVRFFTYWNDKRRIDIDLHASYANKDGSTGHVGYWGDYKDSGLVHSGDITHSNAAEYIDIDFESALKSGVSHVQFNINSFTRVPFAEIDTVFTGLMAVSKMREEVKLYDQKNVFFRHDLEGDYMSVDYAYIDIEKRLLYILGNGVSGRHNDLNLIENMDIKLSIKSYLNILISSQGATKVSNKEDADVILGLPKSDEDNYYSLIDENYFMGE